MPARWSAVCSRGDRPHRPVRLGRRRAPGTRRWGTDRCDSPPSLKSSGSGPTFACSRQTMTPSSEVRLIALTKTFGRTLAVDAISAEIPGGSYCCLLGPSGCGKTTTLRMIAGHEAPTSGDVTVGGARVTDLPPARRRTAMMFQNYALFPHLDCIDNVAFSLRMRGVPKVERRVK